MREGLKTVGSDTDNIKQITAFLTNWLCSYPAGV